jgi:aspartate/methionine/tyrosine aminotransferase
LFPAFELEQYLLRHEPDATISLCASGLEPLGISELLSMADSESLALWGRLSLEYTQPHGLPALREELSRQYLSITSEQISVFAGAAEAIMCTLQGLLTPTDHAIVVVPCYQSLESIPASCCEISKVELEEAFGWRLNLEKIENAIKPNTKIIIINFPNNPTGALPDRETFYQLVEIARRHNLYLFSDEVYRLMELDPTHRLPAAADCYEKGISVSSMSKVYGLPGIRIGWVSSAAPGVLRAAMGMKHYMSICPNSAGELLALMALRTQEHITARGLSVMQDNLPHLQRFFERFSQVFDWTPPQGGCLGFPRLRTQEPIEHFALRLLHEEGVLILPGNLYGWSGNRFRISYGRRNMGEALTKLEKFIKTSTPATTN